MARKLIAWAYEVFVVGLSVGLIAFYFRTTVLNNRTEQVLNNCSIQ
jgi:hypothetical protein